MSVDTSILTKTAVTEIGKIREQQFLKLHPQLKKLAYDLFNKATKRDQLIEFLDKSPLLHGKNSRHVDVILGYYDHCYLKPYPTAS